METVGHGNETILLAGEASEILESITKPLEQQGYTVLTAVASGEAIRLFEEYVARSTTCNQRNHA